MQASCPRCMPSPFVSHRFGKLQSSAKTICPAPLALHGGGALCSASSPRLGQAAMAVNGEQILHGLASLAGMMGPMLQAAKTEQALMTQLLQTIVGAGPETDDIRRKAHKYVELKAKFLALAGEGRRKDRYRSTRRRTPPPIPSMGTKRSRLARPRWYCTRRSRCASFRLRSTRFTACPKRSIREVLRLLMERHEPRTALTNRAHFKGITPPTPTKRSGEVHANLLGVGAHMKYCTRRWQDHPSTKTSELAC